MTFMSKKLTEATVKDIFKLTVALYLTKNVYQGVSVACSRNNWFPYNRLKK
jgi:hypothetical protein